MNFISKIFQKYAEWIVMSSLTVLSVTLAISAHELLFLPLAKANNGERLGIIASLSFGLFLLFFFYSIYLRIWKNKPKSNDYLFNEINGVCSHKKTGKFFCTSCLIKNIESPLKTLSYGWICLNKECNSYYNDPNNPEPESTPIVSSYVTRKRW
jgi:hypothetical protein